MTIDDDVKIKDDDDDVEDESITSNYNIASM